MDVIGLGWTEVHDEACRWEHVMSEQVETRLVEVLGDPTCDPYGNPLPGVPVPAATSLELAVRGVVEARGRIVRIARLGYSPEWTAGLRRRPIATALLATGVLLCTLRPYLGFPALYLAALCCVSLYTRNEPLELLLLPEKSPARLLTAKIRTACRNYFLLAAPFALLAALLHPEGLWLAALWAPLSALLLVYGVLAKYAVYDPAAPEAAASTASMLGLAGFIVWPLLPITLAMLVSHALRAEKNLNRYLYDYD